MKLKLKLLLVFAVCLSITGYSQSVHVKSITTTSDGKEEVDLADAKDINVDESVKELKSIVIKCDDLPANHKLTISVGAETKDYTITGSEIKIDFTNDILNKEISIKHFDGTPTEIPGDAIKFRIIPKAKEENSSGNGNNTGDVTQEYIDAYLAKNYDNFVSTPFGYLDPNDKEHRIHIFFDYMGNSLKSTIPQGISNAQYTVHVIYPFKSDNPNEISYTVKQKTGTFSSALLFNNTGIRNNLGSLQAGEKYDGITERKFILGTATDDLSFDIIAGTKDAAKITKTVLDTYTIKMSPTYHGSFDIGLLKTDLSNPIFSLVQLPNSTDKVIKLTDDSPKGVVTIMASFYVSPIILLESLVKKVPYYKLSGRNFLDDHKIYERFYPTIGVGVSDKTFENFFYGINWELARGLSIFGGWHYGKVNTFEKPDYVAGVTPVTDDEFAFHKNTRWKTSTAIGVKLDILIIKNLFGLTTAP